MFPYNVIYVIQLVSFVTVDLYLRYMNIKGNGVWKMCTVLKYIPLLVLSQKRIHFSTLTYCIYLDLNVHSIDKFRIA
jgi:hypothetical protein